MNLPSRRYISVEMRHASDTESQHLCEIDYEDIPRLIATIEQYGISGVEMEVKAEAHFTISEHDGAYLEIIVDDLD
jgi:hypothetical protein